MQAGLSTTDAVWVCGTDVAKPEPGPAEQTASESWRERGEGGGWDLFTAASAQRFTSWARLWWLEKGGGEEVRETVTARTDSAVLCAAVERRLGLVVRLDEAQASQIWSAALWLYGFFSRSRSFAGDQQSWLFYRPPSPPTLPFFLVFFPQTLLCWLGGEVGFSSCGKRRWRRGSGRFTIYTRGNSLENIRSRLSSFTLFIFWAKLALLLFASLWILVLAMGWPR